MKRYKVYWLEYHDPLNWGDGDYDRGIEELKASLPTTDIRPDPNENDGWVECECEDTFEADNDMEAYSIVINNYEIQSDIFTIVDENGNRVATEEGVINDAYCPYCKNKYNSDDGHSCWEKRSGLAEPKGE